VNPMDFLQGLSPLALAVMLAGLMAASLARGYSGFGFSALLVASWSLVTSPAKAVALALVLEVTASVFQAYSVWKDIPWKRVGLLMAGAIIGTPAGVYLLANTDERLLRLGIAVFILIAAVTLIAGFSFKSRANAASTAAVGVASGACNGAVAMGGLPVALFLTADGASPRAIRAAVVAYFFLLDIAGIIFLSREGLVGAETFGLAVLALPVLLIGMWLGGRQFLGASPEGFRRVTLGLLIVLAVLGIMRALWS
jgi:uncharacterized membrane protein YfcA